MYMQQYACMHVCRSRLRMDGRRMEREGERARYPKREEKEEEEEEEDQEEETITNNSIYIYIYISTHTPFHSHLHQHQHQPTSLFPKTFTNLISHHPKKCNSSPSSPPQPSQPLPLRSSRPEVERKSAPVEHHTVANWTFWALLLFLARMVSTWPTWPR